MSPITHADVTILPSSIVTAKTILFIIVQYLIHFNTASTVVRDIFGFFT